MLRPYKRQTKYCELHMEIVPSEFPITTLQFNDKVKNYNNFFDLASTNRSILHAKLFVF